MSKTQKPAFDFAEALKQLQSGQALTGKDGILTPLIKQLGRVPIWIMRLKIA